MPVVTSPSSRLPVRGVRSRSPLVLGLLVVLLSGLLLSGCGGGGHDDADVAFATQMVPHHRQAVQMSDELLAKTGVDADVRELATTIKAEQAPEIETMTGWLSEWGAPAPAEGTGEMGGMDGMMSQAEMDAFASAQGEQAQALFLKGMIAHHQGAVAMARTEQAQGENADAKALAASIVTSQQAEIEKMQQLQAG